MRANILLTTHGSIQLCDFGVAGTLSAATDKRSTFIGTPHWMAPELFTSSSSLPSYGVEVDIWAFGAVVYEVATGLPPNASSGVPYGRPGQTKVPRLEGGEFSAQLRDITSFCLEENPTKRPTIGEVQGHPYIHNTTASYPTATLIDLIAAFHIWEDDGGARASLFMSGGAAEPSDTREAEAAEDEEWDFDSTLRASTTEDTGSPPENPQSTPRAKGGRRRPPPSALAPLRAPIEKVFDPNTLSNYEWNSRAHYFPSTQDPGSDLPLRGRDEAGSRSQSVDVDETLKSPLTHLATSLDDSKRRTQEWTFTSSLPAVHDGAETEVDANRRTKDWTFASSLPAPLSFADEVEVFGEGGGGGGYAHTPTRPQRAVEMHLVSTAESLIDLDMSLSPRSQLPSQYPQNRASTAASLIDLGMSLPSPPPPTTPLQPTQNYSPPIKQTTPSPSMREQILTPGVAARALPAPPSVEALTGAAGLDVVRGEMGRLLGGLVVELGVVRDVLARPGVL
ncbi:hypothetical protein VE02_02873 [Pseudogymnoascus sp. 03VT05]|nr:hypothetical protein VE02_02873 [Pseudogymnoascus sp. 03VT05]